MGYLNITNIGGIGSYRGKVVKGIKEVVVVGLELQVSATAATRLRRLDEHAQITVFERSGYISYANCGLPYYIGGVIEDKEELTLQTPESIGKDFA